MSRYNRIERTGISKVQSIITEEIGWIFREQPVVDVGIDALVEEAKENDPCGKFIAFQIKSGDSHVYNAGNFYIHYISNIHKEYWVGMSIPVILVIYLPSEKVIIWEKITLETLEETNNKWKVTIPKNKILNNKSLNELSGLTLNKENSEILKILINDKNEDFNSVYNHVQNLKLLNEATRSINLISNEMRHMGESIRGYNEKLLEYSSTGLTDQSIEVLAIFNSISKKLLVTASRFKSEVKLFSALFSSSIWSVSVILTLNKKFNVDPEGYELLKNSLRTIPSSIIESIKSFEILRNTVIQLPKKYPNLKIAKNELANIIGLIISEVSISKEMVSDLIDNF